jgi:hypothetical protein
LASFAAHTKKKTIFAFSQNHQKALKKGLFLIFGAATPPKTKLQKRN